MFFNLPNIDFDNTYIFTAAEASGPNTAITNEFAWTIPQGVKFIYIMCIGGGGGGGSGLARAPGAFGGGGGGGNSGNINNGLWPVHLLPEVLYITVGRGGTGAANGVTRGANGFYSAVKTFQSGANANYIAYASGGNGSQSGSTPLNGTVYSNSNTFPFPAYNYLGAVSTYQGDLGGTLTFAGGGKSNNIFQSKTFLTGGGFGGSVSASDTPTDGDNVYSGDPWIFPYITGGVGANPGGDGSFLYKWFRGFGGAGTGGASVALGGSKAGKGGIGCGGGGGGAGTGGGWGGGDGGDGMVIIKCW